MKKYKVLVNGNLIETYHYFDVINPSTEEIVGKAPLVNREIVDNCVTNAVIAFTLWNKTSIQHKRKWLSKLKQEIQNNQDMLAELLVKEQGKTLKDANDEIEGCYNLIDNYLQFNIDSLIDEYEGTETHEVKTIRVPLGVCVLITPWNYPIFTAIQKICPAIMLGNTVILKPSPFTPLTSLLLGEIIYEIFPKGVINILTGLDQGDFMLGSYLTSHPNISKISFTGSTNTGRKIMQAAALDFKRITLEMGGNDTAIVLKDINKNRQFFQNMVKNIFDSAFANTGALCCAIKRVYVHQSIFKRFVQEIVKIAQNTIIGDGFSPTSNYGPINNKMQLERGIELIQDAITNGAFIECGGKMLKEKGYFYQPTIITNVTDNTRIVKEEQFFPALPIMSYETEEEAIKRANNTKYGLGGSIWSSNTEKACKLAKKLRVGTSWVNAHSDLTGGEFGGRVGFSGFGRELGKADLYAFTESQTLMFPRK